LTETTMRTRSETKRKVLTRPMLGRGVLLAKSGEGPELGIASPLELEAKREELLRRLETLRAISAKHAKVYKTACTLLNAEFEQASLVARGSILQASEFLIHAFETNPMR